MSSCAWVASLLGRSRNEFQDGYECDAGLYMAVFFGFLFGPLIVMGVSSFNTSTYPQVYPIEGLTLAWFDKLLNDRDMVYGLKNSLWIGMWVVVLSVPLGLAAAMMMSQIYSKARSFYYVVVVSPVLTPGVIIGISTVVFWRDLTTATNSKFLYDGVFMAVLGQSSFISAYCMLMFMSRLNRFDRAQEEAGLDLGASQTQVFFHILLPFLRPAIFFVRGIGLSLLFRELQHHDLRHSRRQDIDHRPCRTRATGNNAGHQRACCFDHRRDRCRRDYL